jgi:hypothetical protein
MKKHQATKSSSNLEELAVSEQNKIFGGLEAGNSITYNGDGTVSTFNYTHLESGDRNKVVNQVNAPAGSSVHLTYPDNNNVLNQVNNDGSMVVLEGV